MAVLTCPTQRQLLDFLLGRLAEDQATSIEEHVPACRACQAVLAHLDAVHDPLLRQLRQASASDPLLTEQALLQLLPRLELLSRPAGNTTADNQATPGPERPGPLGGLQPGALLGRYRIVAKLGQGGMGTVYKAHDPQLNRTVAIKVPRFDRDRPDHATAVQRFLREARLAAGVRHAHVCPVYDVGEHDGSPFGVMAFIEGQSLGDLIKHDRLDVSRAVELVRKAALGLEAVHAQGLVHRDLKPANILLDGAGEPLLTDFGLARPVTDEEHLTQEGAIVGTPAFMAPEQTLNETANIGPWTDVYSLGVVLYRLLTGRQPFDGPPLPMMYKIAHESPPAPATLRPALDAALEAIVLKAMAKKPEQRYRSARELAEALAAWSAKTSDMAGSPDPALGLTEGLPVLAGSGDLRSANVVGAGNPTTVWADPTTARAGPSRLRRVAVAALLALLPLAWLFGGTVIRFASNRGELVVEVDDKGVEIKVVRNGVVVQDRTSKREFTLTAGKGEIEVLEKDGIKLATKQFELTRGGKTTVKVTLQELGDARKPKPAAPATETDPDRKAAEHVLSIGGQVKVRVKEAERQVAKAAELPKEPFQLTDVNVENNQQVTDVGLAYFKDCKNLMFLNLAHTQVTDAGLAYLKDCKGLKSLELGVTPITDAGLAHFKDCNQLTLLGLSNTKCMTDAGLAYFKDCKNLTIINVQGTRVTDAGLAYFKDCKNLTYLNLGTRVTDAGLAHFKDCKNLTHLDLSKTGVTGAALAYFNDCENLAELILHSAPVTDAALAHFKGGKNLTKLTLAYSQVTDAGLAHFKDCKNLTWLDLVGLRMTDAGLAYFKDCKNLRHLVVHDTLLSDAGLAQFQNWENLTHLNLTRTQVTDAGLAHLKDCKNLSSLRLQVLRVSDAGLDVLVALPSLNEVWLQGSRVSRHGYEQLKAAMPNCQIEWTEPNRSAAEQALALGGAVAIAAPGKEARPLKPGEPLPREFFQLRRVVLRDVKMPLGDLPATLALLRFVEFDRLEAIDLSGTPVDKLDFLTPIQGLQDVAVGKCGIGGDWLTALPKLKRLALEGNAIGVAGLENLARQSELAVLTLAGAGLADEALAKFPKLPKLKRLALDDNPIRGPGLFALHALSELSDLSLACPTLTDLGVKHLAGLKQLRRLSLAGAALSDAGLKHLDGLTNLQELDLRGTKATAEGVAALQKALPKCKIQSGPAPR